MVLIDRIRKVAELRGIKLGKICELFGEKSNYLSKVERGLRRMDENRIRVVADFLQCDYEYLVGESDFMERKKFPNGSTVFFHTELSVSKVPQFSYERFRESCVAKGITVGYAESRLNLPQGEIDRAEEENRTPSNKLINEMAVLLETTPDYLLCLTNDPSIPLDDRTGVKIKVFGEVAAGIPIQQIDNFDPDDANSWEEIDRKTARNGTYFALKIKGDSMYPEIKDGAVVIVRQQEDIESGQIAVVAINGDTATCKKVILADNGIHLMPINSAYPPKFFTTEQIKKLPVRILGKVVEARNKYE